VITNQIVMNMFPLLSYRTTFKVTTSYTPYKLVYGLHPFKPTKYVMLVINGVHMDANLVRVITNRIFDMEKLQNDKL
jgi:hypothetical protein